MIRKVALTQTESGILHVDDHHRHQYHHNEVYDVEHHSRAMSYDILQHKIKRYTVTTGSDLHTTRGTYRECESDDGGTKMMDTVMRASKYNFLSQIKSNLKD